jgi:hypothetical protein
MFSFRKASKAGKYLFLIKLARSFISEINKSNTMNAAAKYQYFSTSLHQRLIFSTFRYGLVNISGLCIKKGCRNHY